eukprot:COSAG02_NODE_9874_length_2085_cov_6.912387_1_plen_70_part_00
MLGKQSAHEQDSTRPPAAAAGPTSTVQAVTSPQFPNESVNQSTYGSGSRLLEYCTVFLSEFSLPKSCLQ